MFNKIINKIRKQKKSSSQVDLLIDFTINTIGPGKILKILKQVEKAKIYTHNGCKAQFKQGTKVCPLCKIPLR